MDSIITVLIVTLIVGVAVYAMQPKPTFIVGIEDRKAIARKGNVPAHFLHGCESLLSLYEIPNGQISAYVFKSRVSFTFSRSIPRRYHQIFRNVWYIK